jgi:hypothetical protein
VTLTIYELLSAYGDVMKRRSAQARDVRTPKYRPRVVPDRKKIASKRACRRPAAK